MIVSRFLCFPALLGSLLLLGGTVRAQSTIDATLNEGWGANIGWTNWRASATSGAVIGEYLCSGYVYGANVGWINFKATGNPSVNLLNGQLYGYAYSANCGWINLGYNTAYVVKTDSIAPGADTNGNGIADAWELLHFGNLTTATAGSDHDGDGVSDLQEYLEGTDPLVPNSGLRITQFVRTGGSGNNVMTTLTFTSSASRLYRVETSPTLINPTWTDVGFGTFAPDSDASTTRQIAGTSTPQFFRVRALRLGF